MNSPADFIKNMGAKVTTEVEMQKLPKAWLKLPDVQGDQRTEIMACPNMYFS